MTLPIPHHMEDAMSETMLRKQIAGSDITHDDLTRLRTAGA